MNIAVTGSSGFLGSAVWPLLAREGHCLTLMSRRRPPCLPRGVRHVYCNLADHTCLDSLAWDQFDVLIHLAAAGVNAPDRSWPEALDTNVVGSLRLFEAAARGRRRIPVFVMTRSFYEDLINVEPSLKLNPYVATKRAGSDLIRYRTHSYGAAVVFLRVFQVYGPNDHPEKVLSYAARRLARGEPAFLGSGAPRRDWIRLADAAAGLVAVVNAVRRMRVGSIHEFDLGSGQLRSIREMVEKLARIAGIDPSVFCHFDPTRDRGDVALELAASQLLGTRLEYTRDEQGLLELWESETRQRPIL
jgi:nucleoside-diphosphate-sugar epimerase